MELAKIIMKNILSNAGAIILATLMSCTSSVAQKSATDANHNEVYADYSIDHDIITLKLINTTADTLNLFSSYFGVDLLSSRFIHEIDKKNKQYIISFLPLIGNLGVHLSHTVILGDNKIGEQFQMLYNFVQLNPYSYYTIMVPLDQLFRNKTKKNNAVKSFDSNRLSKFKVAKFHFITTKKLKGIYSLNFLFAVYKDISLLSDQECYYLKELQFEKQAKSFRLLTVPVILNDRKYPLLR